MKRMVWPLWAFVLCLCLCACGAAENNSNPSESQGPSISSPISSEGQEGGNSNNIGGTTQPSSNPSENQETTKEVDPKEEALTNFHKKYRIGTAMKLGETYNFCDLFGITPTSFEFGTYAVDINTETRVEHLGVWMQAKLTNTSGGKLDAQMINSVFPYFLSGSLFAEDQDAFVVWLDEDCKTQEYGNHLFSGAIAQIGSSASVKLMDIEPGQTVEVNIFVGGQREIKEILINGNHIFDHQKPDECLLTIKNRIAGYVQFVFGDDVYYYDLSNMPYNYE